MYNLSPLEGTVKFYLLECEPFRSNLLLLFLQECIFLCTYRNDSNNRPGHLINLSFLLRWEAVETKELTYPEFHFETEAKVDFRSACI